MPRQLWFASPLLLLITAGAALAGVPAGAPVMLTLHGLGAVHLGDVYGARHSAARREFPKAEANGDCFYAEPREGRHGLQGASAIITGGKVSAIFLSGGQLRTADGLSIGDTEKRVRTILAAKGFSFTVTPFSEPRTGEGHELEARPRRGETEFDFFMDNAGRVTAIGAGRPGFPLGAMDGCG